MRQLMMTMHITVRAHERRLSHRSDGERLMRRGMQRREDATHGVSAKWRNPIVDGQSTLLHRTLTPYT